MKLKEKICPKCKTLKPISMFSKDKTTKTGYRSYCRECCRKYRRIYYKANQRKLIQRTKDWNIENPGKANKYMKKRRQKIKKEVMEGYGGECVCCGESELAFLTIEHKLKDGPQHLKYNNNSSLKIYIDVIDRDFPDEYTVLCMNCNFATRYDKICPHQTQALSHAHAKEVE